MLLVGTCVCVIHKRIEIMFSYIFIANVYAARELRKVNVDPEWIFRSLFEEQAILQHIAIYRVFKSVWISRNFKHAVFFFRKPDLEIPTGTNDIIAVACDEQDG